MKQSKSMRTFKSQQPKTSVISKNKSKMHSANKNSVDLTNILKDHQQGNTEGPGSLANYAFLDSSVITEKPKVSQEFQYLLKISDDLN